MIITLKTHNFDKTVRMLNGIIQKTDETIHETLKKVADDIIYEARSTLQNNQNINSGDLIANTGIISEEKDKITLGNPLEYAGYIEYGRGPVIPKDPDGVLHWIDKTTGKDVFSKYAAATDPMPFLEPEIIKQSKIFGDLYVEKSNEQTTI